MVLIIVAAVVLIVFLCRQPRNPSRPWRDSSVCLSLGEALLLLLLFHVKKRRAKIFIIKPSSFTSLLLLLLLVA